MFNFLFIITLIVAAICFFLIFVDATYFVYFFLFAFTAIFFKCLHSLDERSKQNEEEIKKIKQHFNIKDGQKVNNSKRDKK
jgi:predicted membrane protein